MVVWPGGLVTRQIDLLLEKPVRRDVDRNPVGQLKVFLGMVGLKLHEAKVSQSGEKKKREYGLKRKGLERLSQIVAEGNGR